MRLILNILWFVFGGWLSGLLWLLSGVLLAITIIGLPWAFAAFRIAGFSLWPFGRQVLARDAHTGQEDLGTGALGFLMNVVWFILGGWYLALSHLMLAVAQAVTIVGIPFAVQNVKLAMISLAPVGKVVVET